MSLRIRTDDSLARKRCGVLSRAGFTLIELMLVITIMLILIGMAAASYGSIVRQAKEAVLKYDLRTIREMIDHYTNDKQTAPQSLEDLSHAGYLREVPIDPMTRAKEWMPKYDSVYLGTDRMDTGLVDVSSKSKGTALDGTKYSDW